MNDYNLSHVWIATVIPPLITDRFWRRHRNLFLTIIIAGYVLKKPPEAFVWGILPTLQIDDSSIRNYERLVEAALYSAINKNHLILRFFDRRRERAESGYWYK